MTASLDDLVALVRGLAIPHWVLYDIRSLHYTKMVCK